MIHLWKYGAVACGTLGENDVALSAREFSKEGDRKDLCPKCCAIYRGRKPRGFALLSLEQRRQIASAGGRRAHELGVAHLWDSHEAAAAGRKGGGKREKRRKARPS